MKKNFLLWIMLFTSLFLHAQTVNISTGIDNAGNPLVIGQPDPNWFITSLPGPGIAETPHSLWIPQPILGTNAQWLNNTGNTYGALVGIQTFERSFSVAPGAVNVNCNFSISYDDNLISLELVRPDNSIFPIPNTVPSPYYYLSPIISTSIPTNSLSGTFKIRAKVDFVDQVGGFLLSGYINTTNNCNVLYDDFNNPSLWSHPSTPYTCATDYNDIGISGGTFNFNQANDNHINYMYRGGLTINNTNFKASIEFTPIAFGSSQGVGHTLLALTTGSKSFGWDHTSSCFGGSTSPCSYPGLLPCSPSNQPGIEVNYSSSSPSGGTYDFFVRVNIGDGFTPPYTIATLPSINLAGSGTVYIKLERTSLTNGTLSVYTNPAMTIHATGSPVSFSSLPASLLGLNTAQIGVNEGGFVLRELTATMDNLCISSSPCNLNVTVSGSGCGTSSCPYVCVGSPAGGVFSGPSGLNPITGVYIGPIPATGLPYTYTYTATNGCVYTVSGLITKPTTSTPPAPPIGIATYSGPSAPGPQLVITWPCTGYTCGEWYEFRITGAGGTPIPGCTSTYSSVAPSNTLPSGYSPLPAGTCGKVLSCPGLVFGVIYEVRMRVNRCGIYGPWSAPVVTPPQRPAGEASLLDNIQVYPNPANETVHINYPSSKNSKVSIQLLDVSGRVVKVEERMMMEGNNEMEMSISNLSNGIYILKIVAENKETFITNLVKQSD